MTNGNKGIVFFILRLFMQDILFYRPVEWILFQEMKWTGAKSNGKSVHEIFDQILKNIPYSLQKRHKIEYCSQSLLVIKWFLKASMEI
jgi:hypothetical protein